MAGFLNPFRSSGHGRRKNKKAGFVAPRQVEDHWSLYRKGLYVDKPRQRGPGWLIPLLALVLIVFLVFWVVPTVIQRLQLAEQNRSEQHQAPIHQRYTEYTWTVSLPVADVYASDDLKSRRIAQALYNEPVRLLEGAPEFGFAAVMLNDGTRGYMQIDDLADYRDSVEPARFLYQLIVASPSKRVMSHASRGTLVAEVMMGTVLFADYEGDSIFRVHLPDGSDGWVSSDGLIVLEPGQPIAIPDEGARYFCNSVLAFHRVTLLEHGKTVLGASMTGVARTAAFVNGFDLPRSLQRQAQAGRAVILSTDPDSGKISLSAIQAGDLVFFHSAGDHEEIIDMAVAIGGSQILYARPGDTSLRLYDLSQHEDLWQRIARVRRIFPGPPLTGN